MIYLVFLPGTRTTKTIFHVFSYTSSYTLHPCKPFTRSVVLSNQRSFEACELVFLLFSTFIFGSYSNICITFSYCLKMFKTNMCEIHVPTNSIFSQMIRCKSHSDCPGGKAPAQRKGEHLSDTNSFTHKLGFERRTSSLADNCLAIDKVPCVATMACWTQLMAQLNLFAFKFLYKKNIQTYQYKRHSRAVCQ